MRVVISLTTVPHRAQSLLRTVDSLLAGTLSPDALYINIPTRYARFAERFDSAIKRTLASLPKVKVNDVDEERGTLDKILPILEIEPDGDTLIAIADDDATYKPLFLQGLVQGYQEFSTVVGYSGLTYPNTDVASARAPRALLVQQHGDKANILEGCFGVLFPRWALQGLPRLPVMTPDDTDIFLSDDYVFARFLDAKGIDKRVLNFDVIGRVVDDWSSILTINEGSQQDSLSSAGNLARYMRVAKRLRFPLAPTA